MFRIVMALAALCLFADVSSAQLFPNAPWNKTYIDSDGCTVDAATGEKISCPLRARKTQSVAPVEVTVPYAASSYAVASAPVVRSGGSFGSSVVSYGSSGGGMFRIGGRDNDGAIISSIGSTVSPTIAQTGTQAIQQLAIGDRVKFRRSLLEAARQARKAGDITAVEFFMLSAASRNPATLDKMQQAIHEAAIEEGLATTQAIDWESLISFIEKLIPIIIKLIDLFS